MAEMRRGIDAARDLGHELMNTYYLMLLAEQLLRIGHTTKPASSSMKPTGSSA